MIRCVEQVHEQDRRQIHTGVFLDNMKEADSLKELNVDSTLIKRILKGKNVDWTRGGQKLL